MNATSRHIYKVLVTAALAMIAGGTVFYHFVEKWNWVDAYYFCVVTLATVGYGDFVPKTDIGKIFTTGYILVGVGIIGAFANALVKRRGQKMREKAVAKHKQ
ncbi:MAG: potassium channel family protein [Candidatus Saccharimonadales bacterium]